MIHCYWSFINTYMNMRIVENVFFQFVQNIFFNLYKTFTCNDNFLMIFFLQKSWHENLNTSAKQHKNSLCFQWLYSYLTAALIKLCKDLHTLMATLEEEVYDWNMKVRKQEGEVSCHGYIFVTIPYSILNSARIL